MPSHKHISQHFTKKKSQILSDISNHDSTDYNDKSPKGTIDSEIIDLIDEINAFDDSVTTSSCAGRVAVFVEGRKGIINAVEVESSTRDISTTTADLKDPMSKQIDSTSVRSGPRAGPGGKGYGNRWLYVSHSPVPDSHLASAEAAELFNLFQLAPRHPLTPSRGQPAADQQANIRLIKLSFSPLILHILCANLHAAKGVLAAAINAGFRESGVQSLKALDDEEAGVMVGIRTAGIAFESVVGCVEETIDEANDDTIEVYRGLVDERYLRMCVGVINERFAWNVERRERLRSELESLRMQTQKDIEWEDKDVRRERKKLEGLRKKQEHEERLAVQGDQADGEDVWDSGLMLGAT